MAVISVTNMKGGTAKTTTAAAIGTGLFLRGYRVLLVDLDAQGNLSFIMGAEGAGGKRASVLEVLQRPALAPEAIQHAAAGDIIASSPALAGLETILTGTAKEYRIKEAINALHGRYDFVVIDCPPALGLATINALAASDGAIVPAQADLFSLQGIAQLEQTIDTVRTFCNPSLRVFGLLLTRYNGRAVISRDMASLLEQCAEHMQSKVYKTRIRECSAIKEAAARRVDVYSYAPRSNAAADYGALVDEILASI